MRQIIRETTSLKKIVEDWSISGAKIYMWGATTLAVILANQVKEAIGEIEISGVIDNNICGNWIKVGEKEYLVNDQGILQPNDKIILCLSSYHAYYNVRKYLEKNMNYLLNVDFIDVRDYIDENSNIICEYSDIKPYARYSPWRKDQNFMDTFFKIKDDTLVDIYRCYELWELVKQTSKILTGDIMEVGVYKGGTASVIAQAMIKAKMNNVGFYLFDTFSGVVKVSDIDKSYLGGEHKFEDDIYVEQLIRKVTNNEKINISINKGIYPDDFSECVYLKNKKWKFVHIDVDIYESGKDIINFIWKDVVSGGMIVFDDYGMDTTNGITLLCDELKNKDDLFFLHNLNGHGIIIKR